MRLNTRQWGEPSEAAVVCLHGVGQHGGIFDRLGTELSQEGHFVVSIDLRGHGGSGHEPPWNTETHADDVLETVAALGLERIAWVGHSFGGRVAAVLSDRAPEVSTRLTMLDAGLGIEPKIALRHAEIDRLDWSFATVDGAVNAMLASDTVVAAPEEVVAAFVRDDVKQGVDGRYRFSFCPSAAVVAWGEAVLPPPPVARLETLLVFAATPLFDASEQRSHYSEALGDLLTIVEVPNGHNVLWESPLETIGAIREFVGPPGGG